MALQEDIAIEVGQNGAVEAYAVLDKQNHLHAVFMDVVLDVHLVLDELYYGKDEVGVAEPAEHIVEDAQVLVLHAARDAVREGREDHTVDVGKRVFDVASHGEGIVVGVAGHADHEVYVHGAQHAACLLGGAHLCERGRIAQAKLHILVIDLLLHAPVVFKHESIVGVGHDKDVIDSSHHKVDKRHILKIKLAKLLWYVGLLFAHRL